MPLTPWDNFRQKMAGGAYHLLRLGCAGQLVEFLLMGGAEIGAQVRRAFPDTGGILGADTLEKGFHAGHAGLVAHGGVDDLRQ